MDLAQSCAPLSSFVWPEGFPDVECALPYGNLEGRVGPGCLDYPEILAMSYCLHPFTCVIFVASLSMLFFVSLI